MSRKRTNNELKVVETSKKKFRDDIESSIFRNCHFRSYLILGEEFQIKSSVVGKITFRKNYDKRAYMVLTCDDDHFQPFLEQLKYFKNIWENIEIPENMITASYELGNIQVVKDNAFVDDKNLKTGSKVSTEITLVGVKRNDDSGVINPKFMITSNVEILE